MMAGDRLKGKRALLTAAGQGIGRACAEAFIAEGAEVIATDLDISKLHGLEGQCHALDVRSTTAVKALAGELGGVDILFNGAGFVHHGTVLDATEDEWDFAFDLNVKSMHRMIAAFLPAMVARGGGSIINMASVVSSIIAAPNRYIYGSSKAAVIGLTKSVAQDFIRKGIRCNAICPGTVESPSLDQRIINLADINKQSVAAARQDFVDRQPMGRIGLAEEVAALAVYLASDQSGFTTGTTHVIDGGFSL